MIVIGHTEECDLRPYRIIHPLDENGMRWEERRPCECGGIRLEVEMGEAHDRETFKLVGKVVVE